MFFTDLPTLQEVVLAKRHRSLAATDVLAVAEATDTFSGAELDGVVVSAMYRAFYEDRELNVNDCLVAAKEVVPLAVTMGDKIAELRRWAVGRTIPAARVLPVKPAGVHTLRRLGRIKTEDIS